MAHELQPHLPRSLTVTVPLGKHSAATAQGAGHDQTGDGVLTKAVRSCGSGLAGQVLRVGGGGPGENLGWVGVWSSETLGKIDGSGSRSTQFGRGFFMIHEPTTSYAHGSRIRGMTPEKGMKSR